MVARGRRRRRAAQAMVEPCSTSEVSTTTKAALNSVRAPGTPAISGNTASTMGTAPRSPTQAM